MLKIIWSLCPEDIDEEAKLWNQTPGSTASYLCDWLSCLTALCLCLFIWAPNRTCYFKCLPSSNHRFFQIKRWQFSFLSLFRKHTWSSSPPPSSPRSVLQGAHQSNQRGLAVCGLSIRGTKRKERGEKLWWRNSLWTGLRGLNRRLQWE